ncbi:MAG: phosphoribosylanthranilate isomerase [bacterium]
MINLQIKVCGLTNINDAVRAEEVGADYGGMILSQGFRRSISVTTGGGIASSVGMQVVAVLVDEEIGTAEHLARSVKASVIQLHGEENFAYAKELRMRGDWTIWKAMAVKGRTEVFTALDEWEPFVDGIVLDGFNPEHPGGTGTKFSWEEIGNLRDVFSGNLELVIAGGLNPDNVQNAVRHLQPDTVDVSSGVESRLGKKDLQLMESFMKNAKSTGIDHTGCLE